MVVNSWLVVLGVSFATAIIMDFGLMVSIMMPPSGMGLVVRLVMRPEMRLVVVMSGMDMIMIYFARTMFVIVHFTTYRNSQHGTYRCTHYCRFNILPYCMSEDCTCTCTDNCNFEFSRSSLGLEGQGK